MPPTPAVWRDAETRPGALALIFEPIRTLITRRPSAPDIQAMAEEALRHEGEEDRYAARYLIHRTLDAKAHLRRLAPEHPRAAHRYKELLALELSSLEELVQVMRTSLGGPEGEEALTEALAELEQLRTEIAWCDQLLA